MPAAASSLSSATATATSTATSAATATAASSRPTSTETKKVLQGGKKHTIQADLSRWFNSSPEGALPSSSTPPPSLPAPSLPLTVSVGVGVPPSTIIEQPPSSVQSQTYPVLPQTAERKKKPSTVILDDDDEVDLNDFRKTAPSSLQPTPPSAPQPAIAPARTSLPTPIAPAAFFQSRASSKRPREDDDPSDEGESKKRK